MAKKRKPDHAPPTLSQMMESHGVPFPENLNEERLAGIRVKLQDLASQWAALQPGETLELKFPPEK